MGSSTSTAQVVVKYDEVDGGSRGGASGKLSKKRSSLKCPSNTAQPPRLGSKRITTMFQSMSPYHPTLDQSNVLLTDQPSAEVAVVDCL